jgi:hypothetical protein
VIYFPPLQEVFQTEALTFHDMVYIIFLSSAVLSLDTMRKKLFASWFCDSYHTSPLAAKKDDDVHMPRRTPWHFRRQLDTDGATKEYSYLSESGDESEAEAIVIDESSEGGSSDDGSDGETSLPGVALLNYV